jgi:hypothetical protein
MRLFGPVLAALACVATAQGAQAQTRVCSARAGESGRGEVSVVMRWDGKAWEQFAVWNAPPAGKTLFPMLSIFYDLAPDGLGPPVSLRVAAMVDADPLPASTTADVVVSLGGDRSWRRPWGMYTQNVRAMRERKLGLPKGFEAGGFTGSVPMAFAPEPDGDSLNTDLLAALPTARTLEVRIEGNAGDDIGRNSFDLAQTAQRDAQFKDAFAKAAEAAKSPQTCKESPN